VVDHRSRHRAVTVRADPSAAELYLDLLKKTLTRTLFGDGSLHPFDPHESRHAYDPVLRSEGRDWPAEGETMIGLHRLDNLQACIVDVLERGVPGDLMETGVWRGGAAIFMRAVLKAYGDPERVVWAADSFAGLPRPDPERFPADAGDELWTQKPLAVPVDEVRANFERYGLLDDRVRFLEGWFRDTLPGAPVEQLALLRLDGDLYESTMVALEALYDRVSPGGYVLVDDYALPTCRAAVEDFRRDRAVAAPLEHVDWTGAFWRKPL
jgi:hypothetical protein